MENFITSAVHQAEHYKEAIKSLKMSEKKKLMDAKLASKKEREDKKKKLLEEKNLKHGVNKTKVENIVEHDTLVIQQYVLEEEVEGCSAILKTGLNKGKLCGCKKIENNGLCKRHSVKM